MVNNCGERSEILVNIRSLLGQRFLYFHVTSDYYLHAAWWLGSTERVGNSLPDIQGGERASAPNSFLRSCFSEKGGPCLHSSSGMWASWILSFFYRLEWLIAASADHFVKASCAYYEKRRF